MQYTVKAMDDSPPQIISIRTLKDAFYSNQGFRIVNLTVALWYIVEQLRRDINLK